MACADCPPYVGDTETVIDIFERTVSDAWGTPTRGAPDWVDYDESADGDSFSQIGVSAIGASTGWGRIIITLDTPNGPAIGARREMQLAIPEIADLDEFTLAFEMAVSPASSVQGIAAVQIKIGGVGDVADIGTGPVLYVQIAFFHFVSPAGDEFKFSTSRDNLDDGDFDNVLNDDIATAHSFDGTITIDRSVSRGSTLITVGAHGTFELAPIYTAAFSGPEKKMYVRYGDSSQTFTLQSSTCSIDNIRLIHANDEPPMRNQPVLDELVAIGDGSTTLYATDWPYLPGSLAVHVAGMLSEVDPADPATGDFELVDPAPFGAPVYASYRAAAI